MMNASELNLPRRRLALAGGLTMLGMAGCIKGAKPVTQTLPCEAPGTRPINRKFVFDRTTLPTVTMVERLVQHVERGLHPGDHLQVVSFGGVTPSLVEESARFLMPARADDAQQRDRARWSLSPDQRRHDEQCAIQVHQSLDLPARLKAVLVASDGSVLARSPIVEAIAATVGDWKGESLELWSDGIEYLGAERSFYGKTTALKLPDPVQWIEQLRGERLLPNLKGVQVTHMAIGLSETPGNGNARGLRPYADVIALKHLWAAYWQATGASHRFGEPLPVDGS